jgi:hypothetical protein
MSEQQAGPVNLAMRNLSSRMRQFLNYFAGFLRRAFQNFSFRLGGLRITESPYLKYKTNS